MTYLNLRVFSTFSHLQFDTVKVQTDGSGMEGTKKKVRTMALKTAKLFQLTAHKEFPVFMTHAHTTQQCRHSSMHCSTTYQAPKRSIQKVLFGVRVCQGTVLS